MSDTKYVIRAVIPNNTGYLQGYAKMSDVDPFVSFVSSKADATYFSSRVLANGWLSKVRMMYRTYNLSLIEI